MGFVSPDWFAEYHKMWFGGCCETILCTIDISNLDRGGKLGMLV
jgi:hypothetical protein